MQVHRFIAVVISIYCDWNSVQHLTRLHDSDDAYICVILSCCHNVLQVDLATGVGYSLPTLAFGLTLHIL